MLVAVGQWVAAQLTGTGCAYEVLNSTALVTRNAQRRGDGWLVGHADPGWSSWLGWYDGPHLLTAVTPASTADQRLGETLPEFADLLDC